MRIKKTIIYFFLVGIASFSISCGGKDEGLNIYSVEDDRQLGAEMDAYLEDSLNILSPAQYPQAYNIINETVQYILSSENINYRNEFAWEVHIVRDDNTINAFAVPGGYIYIYTGLIKYLDCYDHFAGVLAHEIAHADERHSTEQLTKAYGTQVLLDIILGEEGQALGQITNTLLQLSYSRSAEEEADEKAVLYNCRPNPRFDPEGVAGFFQKLEEQGQTGGGPEFLSTHPSPANRIANIATTANEANCPVPANECDAQKMNQLQQAIP